MRRTFFGIIRKTPKRCTARGDTRNAQACARAPRQSDATALRLAATLIGLAVLVGAAPAQAQESIWSGTLNVSDLDLDLGVGCHNLSPSNSQKCSNSSRLSDDDFSTGNVTYSMTAISLKSTGALTIRIQPRLPTHLHGASLKVGNSSFKFRSANIILNQSGSSYRVWNNTSLSWSAGDSVSLKLTVPSTTTAAIISKPRFDNTYLRGESIDVAVYFSEAVAVSTALGSPQLFLALGDDPANLAERPAAYHTGSGTSRLVFRYWVEREITDTTGINLFSNPLRTNGGAIIVGPTHVRRRLPDWMALWPTQHIDGTVAYPAGASIISTPRFLNSYIRGEHIDVAVDFNAAVAVTGSPQLFLALGDNDFFADRPATYHRGSGTRRLVFRYAVQSDVRDTTGIRLYSDPLRLNGGTIREGATDAKITTLSDRLVLMPTQNVNGARTDAACAPPDLASKQQVWTGTVTVGESGRHHGYGDADAFGALDNTTFRVGSTDYEIENTDVNAGEEGVADDSLLQFGLKTNLSSERRAALTLYVCNAAYTLSSAAPHPETLGVRYAWAGTSLDWSSVATRTLYLAVRRNTAATGKPAISGTAMLTAARGTIADADGVPADSTFTYQWIRVDGSSERDISGATASTYTLVAADAGRKFRVRVSFTDALGSEEVRTSNVYPPTVPGAPRNLAVSAGDALAVLTWEAPASDGGADIAEYEYRHAAAATVPDSATWTDVPDSNDVGASTADERGVTVTGLANETAYAFELRAVNVVGGGARAGPVTATPMATACAAPNFGARRNILTGNLMVGTIRLPGIAFAHGFVGTTGGLDDKDFTIGSNVYEIDAATVIAIGSDAGDLRVSLKDSDLTTAERAALRLHVCNAPYDFSAASPPDTEHTYGWTDDLDWSRLSSRTLDLSLPANNAATGKPVISGAAEVGQTLAAETSGIADADGLPSSLTYQWVRVDAGTETDISGATSGTYTLAAGDEGKRFRVKVSFTDDLGGAEELESDPYPENRAPTFGSATAERSFTETVGDAAVATAGNVGAVMTATDQDGDTLSYTLEGTHSGKFTIVATSGQIRTKPGEKYDRETTASYSVTAKASDGYGGTDMIAVTINVDNAAEVPVAPAAPTVWAPSESTTSLDATWTVPGNTGRPDISGYKLRYRQGGGGAWTDHSYTGVGTSTTIASLAAGRVYQVQVRAVNADGDGEWSASRSGSTGTVVETVPGAPTGFTATSGDTEVALSWAAPASTGGAAITHYQYRYAAGTMVPSDVPWIDVPDSDDAGASIADERGVTVTGLANETQYAFEVQAVNGIGAGPAAGPVTATATPVVNPNLPSGVIDLQAQVGDRAVTLTWLPPERSGDTPIDRYQYRYAAGTMVPSDVPWIDVPDSDDAGASIADERGVTVTGLANETQYAFEVQAVNGIGAGPAAGPVTATPTPVVNPNLPSGVIDLQAQVGDRAVTLTWLPPERSGDTPIDRYEYRVAAGSSVPSGASWRSVRAGRFPCAVITSGLENGRRYAFEVRAVNMGGIEGPVAVLTATPRVPVVQTLPTVPRGLRAAGSLYERGVSELGQVTLSWQAPSDLGNTVLVRYEYRYAARGGSLSSAEWNHGPIAERTLTERTLAAGTSYTFQLRAVTQVGAGPAATVGATTPRSERLSLSVFTRGSAVEGETLTIGVRRSAIPDPDGAALAVVEIYDSAFSRPTAKAVDIPVGAREATIEFRVPFDGKRGAARELAVTLDAGTWTPERAYRVGTPSRATVRVGNMDPLVSARDATVREGPQAHLSFDVSLDRTVAQPVTVDYATSDGTATSGADYTATSGMLTFTVGELDKTVSVPVLDDAHNEGIETLTLTLSNAQGAALGDVTATGRIVNDDLMPKAWLARFGRSASDHVIQAITSRLHGDGSAQPESHFTIGARRLENLFDRGSHAAAINAQPDTPGPRPELETAWARRDRLKAEALGPAGGSVAASGLPGSGTADGSFGARSLPGSGFAPRSGSAGRRLAGLLGFPDLDRGLMDSSFLYSSPADGGDAPARLGQWSVWGRTAETRLDGADGPLSVHGEVVTATVGFDTRRNRWLAGVAVSYSLGDGAYTQAQAAGGTLASTLASVSPFARFELNKRTSLWGVFGHGSGRLSLRPDRAGAAIETELTNTMTAFGARTALTALTGRAARFELSLVSDARLTRTVSETVAGLMGATGETSRVRFLLRGAGSMPLPRGGALSPTLEAGLRYDGGNAETGAGVEIGVGLGYAVGRFAVQVNARGLLAHEDAEYKEWGFSGAVRYRAANDGRGVLFDLGSARGATQSGVEGLWNRQDASGLALGAASDAAQRLQANLGYGVHGPKGRVLWVPYVGADAGDAKQALRLGVKLTSGPNVEAGLEFGRRDGGAHAAGQAPDRAMQLRWRLRW